MNKIVMTLALFMVGQMGLASPQVNEMALSQINETLLTQSLQSVSPYDLIDWKVGDRMDYTLDMGFFGKGTSFKEVTKDEGDSIWVRQVIDAAGQNQTIDMQIRKSDGALLKIIRNGKEESIPDDNLEVISQDFTEITVPAGTFKCIHIVANSGKIKNLEVWANPQVTVMDGALKQVLPQGFLKITMELKSFARGQ